MVKMTDQNLELQQAYDFCDESNAVYKLLSSLSDSDYEEKTQFKGWNFNNVIGHLHVCLLYTSPSPRDRTRSRMPSSA